MNVLVSADNASLPYAANGSFGARISDRPMPAEAANCLTVSVRSSLDSCDVGQNGVTEIRCVLYAKRLAPMSLNSIGTLRNLCGLTTHRSGYNKVMLQKATEATCSSQIFDRS
jgi:hypothetical protein